MMTFRKGKKHKEKPIMKTSHKLFTVAAAAALLVGGAIAGAQSPADAPRMHGPGPGQDEAIGFVGFEGALGHKTVTGAPFSASFSTQSTQVLSDGNQIQRATTGTVARDTQGRTRRDMTLPAIGHWAVAGQAAPHMVSISDPVAGAHYMLNPDKKTARKFTPPANAQGSWRKGRGASGFAAQREKETTTVSLGTQTMSGVSAEGTRYTRTIPAGAIGNQNPIQIVTERWYSAELQTYVMTKRTDPREGTTITQLTNIQRQEPDASLFTVPPDYTVTAGEGGGRKGFRGPAQPTR
jgi:hypothetical protein